MLFLDHTDKDLGKEQQLASNENGSDSPKLDEICLNPPQNWMKWMSRHTHFRYPLPQDVYGTFPKVKYVLGFFNQLCLWGLMKYKLPL